MLKPILIKYDALKQFVLHWQLMMVFPLRLLCVSEFQTEGTRTLKALGDNESAILVTDTKREWNSRSPC